MSSNSDRWIAWLRGINVAGKRKMPMKDVRAMFDALGAEEVTTYIQSGNIVFDAAGSLAGLSEGELAEAISEAIDATFGFDVPVMVRSADEVSHALESIRARFAGVLAADEAAEKVVHVHFLADHPTAEAIAALDPARSPDDTYVVEGRELHVYYGNGAGKTKLTPAWIEKTLGVSATARNLRTLEAVLALV